MKRKTQPKNHFFRIHVSGSRRFKPLLLANLKRIASDIDGRVARGPLAHSETRLHFQDPEELIRLISKPFKSLRAPVNNALFEVPGEANVRDCDILAYAIWEAFKLCRRKPAQNVVLVASNLAVVDKSVVIKKKLVPYLERRRIRFLTRGATFREIAEPVVRTEDILQKSSVFFGHFRLTFQEKTLHVPSIISIRDLSRDESFARKIRTDAVELTGSPVFQVVHLGVAGGGTETLAYALADNRPSAVHFAFDMDKVGSEPCLVLCDCLYTSDQLDGILEDIRDRGATRISVICIAQYRGISGPAGIAMKSYISLPHVASKPGDGCVLCSQGVEEVPAESLQGVENTIGEFDPATFWQLVSSDPGYYNVGHWWSTRTYYHYHFRVMTDPLFRLYAGGLAVRLRNVLKKKGIFPGWVQKVVCSDEESAMLSTALARVLHLEQADVIVVPREQFRLIAGYTVGPGFEDNFGGSSSLPGKNVLIVDQAAHHLGTYSALKTICDYYGSTVLGFVVFVNRVDPFINLGEHLPQTHYAWLYSWPSGPRHSNECPCQLTQSRPQ